MTRFGRDLLLSGGMDGDTGEAHASAEVFRTASGRFTVEDAVSLDTFLNADNPSAYLIPPTADLLGMTAVELDPGSQNDILHGRTAILSGEYPLGTLALAHGVDGSPFAVVRAVDGLWKPEKVFSL